MIVPVDNFDFRAGIRCTLAWDRMHLRWDAMHVAVGYGARKCGTRCTSFTGKICL